MSELSGKAKAVAIPFLFATLYYSAQFIDSTTFPKLMLLAFLLTILTFLFLRKSKHVGVLFAFVATWAGLLFAYLVTFGFDSLSSILLGYPQRNLGLLSLLIFGLSLWLFCESGTRVFLSAIRLTGLTLSISIVLSNFFGNNFLIDQFVYPNPGALNSNVLSPILAFALVAWLSVTDHETREKVSLSSKLIKYLACLLVILATYFLGNLQSLLYLIYILSALVLFNLNSKYLSKILVMFPIASGLLYIFAVTSFADALERFGDNSLKERLAFIKLFWDQITSNQIRFMRIDSSADLNLINEYNPAYNAIIDNAHNVWLEIGIHFGVIGFFVFLISTLYLMFQSTVSCTRPKSKVSLFGFREYDSIIVFQQLAFCTLFFVILHPISVWIYGSIVGLSVRLMFQDKRTKSFLPAKLRSRLVTIRNEAVRAFSSKASKKLMVSFTSIVLFFTSSFILYDVAKKYQFRQVEYALVSNQVDYELGLDNLLQITLALNDRGYLDYSGRRLMEAGRCEEVAVIIAEQKRLRFEDLGARLLESTWRNACLPLLLSNQNALQTR